MKTATVHELKRELRDQNPEDLVELCLSLSKFKKENKELLTYLLYEAADEDAFISGVKEEVDEAFEEMNISSYYFIKKTARKILRMIKKYIRYSKKKETETTLLMYFCLKLKEMRPSMERNVTLQNIYDRQIILIKKAISTMHEDLQFDYLMELENLNTSKL
jgi:hypothetical protein